MDPQQLELYWERGQEREQRANDDLLALIQAGVREGMTDVYVALKQLRRSGPQRRRGPRQPGLTGAALEGALDQLALRQPHLFAGPPGGQGLPA